MIDIKKGDWPEHTYSEKDWCPITKEEAVANLVAGYTGKDPYTSTS